MKTLAALLSALADPFRRWNARLVLWMVAGIVVLIAVFSVVSHVLIAAEGHDYSRATSIYWTLTVMSTLGFGDIAFESDIDGLRASRMQHAGLVIFGSAPSASCAVRLPARRSPGCSMARGSSTGSTFVPGHFVRVSFLPLRRSAHPLLDRWGRRQPQKHVLGAAAVAVGALVTFFVVVKTADDVPSPPQCKSSHASPRSSLSASPSPIGRVVVRDKLSASLPHGGGGSAVLVAPTSRVFQRPSGRRVTSAPRPRASSSNRPVRSTHMPR